MTEICDAVPFQRRDQGERAWKVPLRKAGALRRLLTELQEIPALGRAGVEREVLEGSIGPAHPPAGQAGVLR
jgi:hypothetical protein